MFTLDSLNLSVPKSSGSPKHGKKLSPHTSLRNSAQANSMKDSLEASIHSRSQQDATLRQSIEDTEMKLDERVYYLADLTMHEKPRAVSDRDHLEYYKKLESKILLFYRFFALISY